MLDWSVPLRSRNGYKATVLHEYYNGVQQMMVVSLIRGPTCSVPGAKDVELVKIYDKQWGSIDGPDRNDWDLEVIPPPDTVIFMPIIDASLRSPHVYDTKQEFPSGGIAGQIKVVIDGRSGKIKETSLI